MAIRKSPYKLNADGIDEAFILPPRKKDRQPPAIKVRRKNPPEEPPVQLYDECLNPIVPGQPREPEEPKEEPVDLSKVIVSFRTLRDEDEAAYYANLVPPQPNKEVGRREVTFELPPRKRKSGRTKSGKFADREQTLQDTRQDTRPEPRQSPRMEPRMENRYDNRRDTRNTGTQRAERQSRNAFGEPLSAGNQASRTNYQSRTPNHTPNYAASHTASHTANHTANRTASPANHTGYAQQERPRPTNTRARAGMVFPSPAVAGSAAPQAAPAPTPAQHRLAFPSPFKRAAEREAEERESAQAFATAVQAEEAVSQTVGQATETQVPEAVEASVQSPAPEMAPEAAVAFESETAEAAPDASTVASTEASSEAFPEVSMDAPESVEEPREAPLAETGEEVLSAASEPESEPEPEEDEQEAGTFADIVADSARLVAANPEHDAGAADVEAALARVEQARAQGAADQDEDEDEEESQEPIPAPGALTPAENPWGEGIGSVPAGRVHFVRFYTWTTLSAHVCSLRNEDGDFLAPGFVTALQDTRSAQPILNAMRESAMKRGWNINIQMLFVPVVYPERAGFRLWKQVANPFDHNLVYLYYLLKNNALEMVEDHFRLGIETSRQMRNLATSLIKKENAFRDFFADERHANCHGLVLRDAAGIFFGKSFPNSGRLINYCVLRPEWIVDIKPVAGAPDVLDKARKDPKTCLARIRKVLVTTTEELNKARASEERKAKKAGIEQKENNIVLEDGLECILSAARSRKG